MKVKEISELISVATMGFMAGLMANANVQKWHRLGRAAYLTNRLQYAETQFDKHIANQPPFAIMQVLGLMVAALFIFAIYKGLAYIAAILLSAIPGKSSTERE